MGDPVLEVVDENYAARRIFWPAYTWPIQTSYLKIIKSKNHLLQKRLAISSDDLKSRTSQLFDKLNGAFYHLETLKKHEAFAIDMGKRFASVRDPEFGHLPGVAGVPYEPIGYEHEAVASTVKSSLDMLAILIARSLGRGEDEIVTLWSNLSNSKKLDPLSQRFLYTLRRHKHLIESFRHGVSWRNYAVHKGSLPIGTINVPINNPSASILGSRAIDPYGPSRFDPKAPALTQYCEDLFYEMCDITIACLRVIFATRFKPGPKTSMQEQRIRKNKIRSYIIKLLKPHIR